jgi:hypothetical protein
LLTSPATGCRLAAFRAATADGPAEGALCFFWQQSKEINDGSAKNPISALRRKLNFFETVRFLTSFRFIIIGRSEKWLKP